jgi:hypothetical protein
MAHIFQTGTVNNGSITVLTGSNTYQEILGPSISIDDRDFTGRFASDWNYREKNIVSVPTHTDDEISIGDLLFLSTDVARPASSVAFQGSESLTKSYFQDYFLGVALRSSDVGSTDPIFIATTGIFEFDCVSLEASIGGLICPDLDIDGQTLLNDTVEIAAGTSTAIGRLVAPVTTDLTSCSVEIQSCVMYGGPQNRM